MSEIIAIVQLCPMLDYPVEQLISRVSRRFPDYDVRNFGSTDVPQMAFDSFRKQYHSTRVLVELEKIRNEQVEHILGVMPFDLYVPGMNFVFGEARCPGRAAVISTYRLKTDEAESQQLFESRIVKEAVHEIGHMMGLRHCSRPSCVMYFSERVSDTDKKKDIFCSECGPRMKLLTIE